MNGAQEGTHELNDGFIRRLYFYRHIRWYEEGKPSGKVNGLDWNSCGDRLIVSCDDNCIRLFDRGGVLKSQIASRKYGCCLVQFMRDGKSAICGSTSLGDVKNDHKIRHLDFVKKGFIHYYAGHTDQVTSLSVNPEHNCAISSSNDKTVRLWDARLDCERPAGNRNSFGLLDVGGPSCSQFDPTGMVFAVATKIDQKLLMYDLKNYKKGPFLSRDLPSLRDERYQWSQLRFSPSGKRIAISSNSDRANKIIILDAFNCDFITEISHFQNELNLDLEMSWSMDSQIIFVGSSVKFPSIGSIKLNAFDASTGDALRSWSNMHEAPLRCVKLNPRFYSLATACDDVALWQHRVFNEDGQEIDTDV